MVDIVFSVAAKVSEYLVVPVVRQLGYLFNYRTNIEDLSQKVEKLRDARARQQHSVDEAIRNGHKIEDDVCKWMTRADGFIQNACKFLEHEKEARKSCFNGLCPNLKSRYQLSREARKKAGVSVQILEDGQLEKVSYRAPLQGIRSAPSEALESRMLTLNEVMEALRDANINRIGVWGMGGVGKSTLVKQVAEQANQDKLFDKVVKVSVLQTPDFKEIQRELADGLGMKLEEESEQGRAARLLQRMEDEKTILIILDDLWAELELEKVGIPSPDDHKGCKLVLTSRNKQVLSNEMSTQKDFRVRHLQEDETWILFKNTAGDSIENPELQPIAVDVAKECAGLPIAIVTVAKALKNKNVSIWKDALQQLKSQTSTNITGLETKVYSSLKLSYEHLEGDEVKSLCLLCGLFSSSIHIRDLLKYGVGLRLFRGTNTLEEAKNRIDTLVDNLKSSNFLLETDDNAFVRMHDLVRSTARKIASEQRHVFTQQKTTVRVEEWSRIDELQVTWVKLHNCDVHELPEGLVCPKLEFFECFLKTNLAVEIPNTFFEGMKQLKVLDLSRMQLPSLPLSLQCLANLRTLCLDGCKLGDIVLIAELKKLEILSLMDSDIEQLPREIAQLTHLRLFDLADSSKLKVIPPDVISSLFRLEDLSMENSFTQWEEEGKSNACLAELKHLSHLTSLDIQIPDAKLLPKDLVFDNLVRYRIFVGDVWSWGGIFEANSTLKLNKFDTSLHLVDGISKLLKRTEDLHLHELCGGTNVLSKLNREGFLKLKHLNVESSPEIQYIVNSMDLTSSHGAFPVMDTLSLNQLINLQEVCHGQFPPGSFGCLRKVEVEDCDGLKCLFSLSVARGLSRLEEIKVTRCKSMVEMVSQGRKEIKEDAVNVPLFPELRSLTLQDLPKLSNFCFEENPVLSKPASTIVGPSTPPLNQPEIRDCQLLLSLGGNLRSLKLKNCMSLSKLFPPSLLPNLEELIVENCGQLEHVFDLEGLNVDDGHVGLLPKLGVLKLIGLPKLRHICNCGSSRNHFPSSMASASVSNIIFPKLFRISLESLPTLTSFVSPGYHSLQRLHHADLDTPFPVLFDERVAFPSLKFLKISGLDNVKKIRHNQIPQDSFSKLEMVTVEFCGQLLNIFSSCMLKRLQSLEDLSVRDCSSLEAIFDVEGTNDNVDRSSLGNTSVFPKLTSLSLINLHQLRSFYPGALTSQWSLLKKLKVQECHKLNVFAFETPTFQQRHHEGNHDMPLFLLPHVAFPNLEELTLGQNRDTEIWPEQFLVDSFPKLRVLSLYDCKDIVIVIPSFMLQGLHNLEVLKVGRCSSVEEVFQLEGLDEENQAKRLGQLREIELHDLPGLTRLWKENSKPGLDLQSLESLDEEIRDGQLLLSLSGNLRSLKLKNCMSLWKLFPPSLLQNLEELIVENCGQLEHVFDLEGLNVDDGHVGLLPKLGVLKLIGLPKLRHTCNCGSSRNHFPSSMASAPVGNIIFPKLSHILLESLPNLTSFVSPGYHSLQRLHHADLDTPFPVLFDERVAFPSLELLDISGLDNVKKIWHNQNPQDSFSKLEVVNVASCGELLNIFPSCMLKRLQCLQVLKVVDCSLLEEVFDVEGTTVNVNVKEGVTVTQLSQLILESLPKVEKIWNKDPHGILKFQNLKSILIEKCQSLKNLFPASFVKDLVQLENLELRSCGIEEIVAKDNEVETAAEFVFPKVTSLELFNLHQLRSFYPGAHTSRWPLLKELIVRACDKVNVFASETPTFQRRHHEGGFDMPILQPLFLLQQVAFPYLEELTLNDNNNTEIWQEQFPMDSFPRLRYLNVRGYGDILVVIPSFMLQRLHNLENLVVRRCSSVKEIFQLEGLDEKNQAKRLGRLREIRLHGLPALTHLWKENSKSGSDLQSLESLEVWHCDSLINLVSCSVSFQNLDTLEVWSCGSLRSLIPPSVAKSLVKLKKLKVGGSQMMEEVVANEGGEAADEIAFCELQHMALQCLPNLTSFNSRGYVFSFPSLEHMVVEECPKMKIFSPSLVTTPKLERVEVADDEWHWQDDLNTTIHNLFIKTHGVFLRNLGLLPTWR
ncbi:hypothetical protein PVL29_018376 [Vitis rotundifolia]|uniref:AAA+ ATPase domain-containing protein n=1 Tax=Vitis rotundifolia TaxID=103349 RepID=A0AA38Z4W6_VITRO|nr:hypothetical protein PVL29_018376 [Vitis rotundifolia]